MSDAVMWYVAIAGQQQGPFGKEDIINKLKSGEIDGQTHLFAQGVTANWTPLAQVAEFATALNESGTTPPPVPVSGGARQSHEIDHQIYGDDLQFVEIELDPGETVIAEAGAMMFMEDGIDMETRFGDGSKPDQGFVGKLWEGAKRKLTGESLFMTWFSHQGTGKGHVAFGAPYPGKVVALDLKKLGGQFICQKDAFLCAAMGTEVGIAFNKRIGAGFFGGEGFILQKLTGDGKAFVHACGTIVNRTLKPGETLRVDTGCLVGFTPNVTYDIQLVKKLKSIFFGGEGLFLATLTGPGEVWLQSLPFSRLADRIYAAAPQGGGKQVGEGSVLGGVFNMIGGD